MRLFSSYLYLVVNSGERGMNQDRKIDTLPVTSMKLM